MRQFVYASIPRMMHTYIHTHIHTYIHTYRSDEAICVRIHRAHDAYSDLFFSRQMYRFLTTHVYRVWIGAFFQKNFDHLCIYVCMYVCTCGMVICMCIIYVCMHVCAQSENFDHLCMYVCMYACMYVCMHACMQRVKICVLVLKTHTCTYVHIHAHTYISMCTH